MFKRLIYIIVFLSLSILIFNNCEKDTINNNIIYETFNTYWIDSTYKIDSLGSFFIITNNNNLDSIFKPKKLIDTTIIDSIYNFIDEKDFNSNYAVAIIKSREPNDFELKIMSISLDNDNLLINYKYQNSSNYHGLIGYYNYALALFDKCSFNKIYFYQNDTLIKSIDFP